MEAQIQAQTQVQSVSVSLPAAIKYAKLVDLADIIYKQAVANNDTATQQNPSLQAYKDICNNSAFQLLIDKDFLTNYNVLYNVQAIENKIPVYFGFIAQHKSSSDYVIAIRGTESQAEWGSDFFIVPTTFNEFNNNAQVPSGFYNLYETCQIVSPAGSGNPVLLKTVAANPAAYMKDAAKVSTVVAGHSLGATLATYYAAAVSVGQGKGISLSVYTYASPMTGDINFSQLFNKNIPKSYRIFNIPDNVPNLPQWFENKTNIYTQVATGSVVDSTNDKNVTTGAGCAHQLPVYQYLLEKLGGNVNPDILSAGFCKCKNQ
ncbi:lipase family protein [Chitinophaga vietnamensis]|uniref:lipase family protein n=1 Tax=Chitinophaga vietnamensis TaxID=2593957 RepID=UPI0011773947|nr:lipase family protein [Chitinophaga vietnamensis]